MDKEFRKASGISLITGSLLLIATMILHPSGGSMEHILKIKNVVIISHSLAILSLPIIGFGFWGLSQALMTGTRISMLGFFIILFGLFAGMIAATVNGLTLPLFLSEAAGENQNTDTIELIITYGRNLNIPMDYILILSFGMSICIWSYLIIKSVKHKSWMGYYGILIVLIGLIAGITQFNMISVSGFRIVVFGIVSWITIVAYKVLLRNNVPETT